MKKRVMGIIFLMLLSFQVFSIKIKASSEELNIRYAVELFWTNSDQVSTGSEYHLVSDEFDGNFFTIPSIATYSLTATMGNISAFNAVKAIYPGHSEAYAYFVFMVDLEELHFYNHKIQYKEKVPFDELVTIISTSDDPHKDYNDGFIDGFGHGQTSGYNNGYQEGKSDGIDIGFNDGYQEGKSDGIDIGFNDGFNYLSKEYLNIEVEGKTSSDEVVFAVGVKYRLVGGSTWSIIDDKGNYLSSGLSRMSLNGNFKVKVFWGSSVYNYTIDSIGSHKTTGGGGSSISIIKFYINESEVGSHITASTYGTSHSVYIIFEVPNLNRIKYVVDNHNYFNTYNFEGFKGDIVPPLEPYKKNQYFIGWFEEDSEEAFNFDAPLVNDVVLYAIYGLPNTITFNTNGGNNIPSLNEIAGAEINPPDNPIKSGYEFIGWYSDPNFEEEFEFDLMPDDDITLYAKWEANEYTIEFYLGEELYSTKTVIGNENVILPATPTKENEQFLGWYYDEEFTEQFKVTDPIEDDVTLYGKFGSGGSGGTETPPEETPGTEFKLEKKYVIIAAIVFIGIGLALIIRKRK